MKSAFIVFQILALVTVACSSGAGSGNAHLNNSSATVYKYFTYVSNGGDNTLSAASYTTAGVFTSVAGSPFNVGTHPYGPAITPNGKFLYTANHTSNDISAFSINSSTGVLTAIAGQPFAVSGAAPNPQAITVDPTGSFLFVANINTSTISSYTINASTGIITQVAGSPFALGTAGPTGFAVTPNGKFLIVSSPGSLSSLSIDSSTGVLAAVAGSPLAIGGVSMVGVTISTDGNYLYGGTTGGAVNWYSINSVTGAITAPLNLGVGPTFYDAVVDASGKYLYVSGNAPTLYSFSLSGGVPSVTSGAPYTPAGAAFYMCADASGKLIITANWTSPTISIYQINSANGNLTEIAASPYSVGTTPDGCATIAIAQ